MYGDPHGVGPWAPAEQIPSSNDKTFLDIIIENATRKATKRRNITV